MIVGEGSPQPASYLLTERINGEPIKAPQKIKIKN